MLQEKTILDFISHFSKSKDTFLNGQCYWFAVILLERFYMFAQCEIYYNPIENHFAVAIDSKLYDASGNIGTMESENWFPWQSYQGIDELETSRIYRDCILQIGPEELKKYNLARYF